VARRDGVVAAEKMRILRGQESGIRGQESGVEKKIRDIAAAYGYIAAVRGEIDFAAFRRDVESLVNGETPPAEQP
jgi:hypothetical protein